MADKLDRPELVDLLIGIILGGMSNAGRGGPGVTGENPFLGIPTFGDAIREDVARQNTKKAKRAVSKAQKAYGRAFKRLAPKFKKKNGSWKKDGFKRCVRAAHADCRRKHR